ncbi:MAG: DUF4491 family protein [Lachnospiraceae bacterium]|nr:DUF4491 family protein [Lachnospiraceae bacterium]
MNIKGLLVGATAFLLIGIFHAIVVKTEYYLTKNVWPVFFLVGLCFLAASLTVSDVAVSSILAIIGVTCLWSIKELFQQEERVKKGWFPENPRRKRRDRK